MKPVNPTFFIVMAIREAEMQLGDFYDEYICQRARLLLGWPDDDQHGSAVSNVYRSMHPARYQLKESK
jgi:hypothetical protein